MATKVKVMGSNPGFPGRWRAGSRHWANGVTHVLEVVDDPVGGASLGEADPIDPKTGLSSMTQISNAGLAALEADKGYINVLKGADADAVSAKASALEFENAELKACVASLEAGNTSLKDRCVELEAELAKAKGGKKDEAPKGDESDSGDSKADGGKPKNKGGK